MAQTASAKQPTTLAPRDWWGVISSAMLASLLAVFAWVHLVRFLDTGRPVGLGLVVQETITAGLFIIRRRPRGTSRSPLAWMAGVVGTFAMLFARPTDEPVLGLELVWTLLQLVGAGAAITGLMSLGRSFGLVAANRGVKTGGMYRIVRHPLYASYLVTHTAYVLQNPTAMNVTLLVVGTAFQLVRIHKEEAWLSADPAYVAYQARVRYRLLPLVY